MVNGSGLMVKGMKRQNGISRIDDNWELIVSYSVIIEKNKNLENPFWRLWLLQSLCAKCYGPAFKNKFLRQFPTSYHITIVITNLRRKNHDCYHNLKNKIIRRSERRDGFLFRWFRWFPGGVLLWWKWQPHRHHRHVARWRNTEYRERPVA